MSKRKLQSILGRLRGELTQILGDQLVSVILYGSHARRQAHPGSDIDVLVVVQDDSNYATSFAALRKSWRPSPCSTM
jgi:predicted nucleotidyltransferase